MGARGASGRVTWGRNPVQHVKHNSPSKKKKGQRLSEKKKAEEGNSLENFCRVPEDYCRTSVLFNMKVR
jgi:hypothetical protein